MHHHPPWDAPVAPAPGWGARDAYAFDGDDDGGRGGRGDGGAPWPPTRAPSAPAAARAPHHRHPPHPLAAAYDAGRAPDPDRVVAVAELPPTLRPAFPWRYFNLVQSDTFDVAYGSDAPFVVAAPTGAGKTGVLELALCRLVARGPPTAKALYLAPSRALVSERVADWRARFGAVGVSVAELTGEGDPAAAAAASDRARAARLIVATPEKIDAVLRGRGVRGAASFVGDVGLVLVDEVHLLADGTRGATLEAVVARLKTIGAQPRLASSPLARARCVAVSATLPNAATVGAWLGAPADCVRCYGDEVRPVPLAVHVRAYPATSNDFLFEKSLDAHLPAVLAAHADGRPALIFCASRKGAESTARSLATGSTAAARRASLPASSHAALDAAAARAADRGLADCLRAGVGVHHAGLEGGDRAAVESLFAARHLPALCTTSTLATGVNLPAYLVVVKGTRRWVGEGGGGAPGFRDYDAADVLQMLGRAGRPQHDVRGVGVVMTRTGPGAARMAALAAGAAPVVSRLGDSLVDHLNAEIVLRTVTDVETAVAWLKATFLWARVRADPAAHGFPAGAPPDVLERLATQRYISSAIDALTAAGLASADAAGTGLAPLPPGEAAARHYVRLASVARIRSLPAHASLPDILDAVCGAAEFEGVTLRRGEKKALNALNRAAAAAGLPTVAGGGSKARASTPVDKLFILAVDACGPNAGAGLDFSMRREAETLLRVGARVAACARAVLRSAGAFAGAANAARLERALAVGAWDGTDAEVRQLRGVGGALGARLAAANFGRLAALRAAEPRAIELATGRAYPFGADLLAAADALAPPGLTLTVAGAAWRAGGRLDARVVLTRTSDAPPRAGGRAHHGLLIVGTPADDGLLAAERVTLDTFKSPLTLAVATRSRAPLTLVAALLPERVVGADVTASAKFGGEEAFGGEGEGGGVAEGAAVNAPPAGGAPAPLPSAHSLSPAPRAKRQTTLFDRFKYKAPAGAPAGAGAAASADPLPLPRDLSPAASTSPPSAPPPAPSLALPLAATASKEGGDEYADVFSFL